MEKERLRAELGDETATPVTQVLYLCNPDKNKDCLKTSCYKCNMNPQYGVCMYTTKPEYRANGRKYFYDVDSRKIVELK